MANCPISNPIYISRRLELSIVIVRNLKDGHRDLLVPCTSTASILVGEDGGPISQGITGNLSGELVCNSNSGKEGVRGP